jgi:hypothetical protein
MHQHRTSLLLRLDDGLDGPRVSINLACCVASQGKSKVPDPFCLRDVKFGSLIGVVRVETIEVDDRADVIPVHDACKQKPRDLAATVDLPRDDDPESLGNNPITESEGPKRNGRSDDR